MLLLIHNLNLCPDYRYPYTWRSGPAPGSHLQAEGLHHPLVSLQHEAAPQQSSSLAENQYPSSVASSQSYDPNRFIVTSDSSSNKPSRAPEVAQQSAGYVWPPVGSGKRTPGSFEQPQSVASTSGGSNMGPVHQAPPVLPYGYGDAPVYYAAAPARFDEVPSDTNTPGSYGVGAGPLDYGSQSSPGLPWNEEPAGGADASFPNPNNWMPTRNFPDFSAWEAAEEAPQSVGETSPLPPSSYIIQSRNGYLRAREVLSHSKYSPEYPEPPVYRFNAVKAPSKSPLVLGSKGGY